MKLKSIRITAARLVVRCSQSVTLKAEVTLPSKAARKLRTGRQVASGKAVVAANADTRVTLRFTAKARTRLRRLSGSRLRRLRPTLTLSVAGSKASRKVRLSR